MGGAAGGGETLRLRPTRLLYFEDATVKDFEAEVLAISRVTRAGEPEPHGGGVDDSGTWPGQGNDDAPPPGTVWAVELDQTAFYPGGGGQPPDSGTLAGLPVLAAGQAARSTGVVLHYLGGDDRGSDADAAPPLLRGQRVRCALDWDHRFDLMQQHTGQHILSAVAMRDFGAATTGFHLGEETATVDLQADPVHLATAEAMELYAGRLERLANTEVFADRAVEIRLVPAGGDSTDSADPAQGMGLRVRQRGPAPKGGETWRVIDIAGLDLSPCGGTHVSRTGQVGMITISRWEKIRDSIRLEFACGYRALSAARRRHDDLRRLALYLTAHEREAVDQALRKLADGDALRRELSAARAELLDYQAQALAAAAETLPQGSLVVAIRPDLGPDELKILANAICRQPGMVALLAVGGAVPRLVFARSENVASVDAGRLLRQAAEILGARGGGSPKLAQGGGGDPAKLDEAMAAVGSEARAALGIAPR